MEKVIYSNKGGLGIILDIDDNESDYFDDAQYTIGYQTLKSGDNTTLYGMFTKEIKFVGTLKDDHNCMVFYTGENADLFNYYRYYYCIYWISENRIANKYTENSARDFILINGKWK